ncbi:membrane lipoprotein lipid attachment site-containing protein [Snodgrassella sp.]|uniref:membrane lipoprotein lipid attachment site-containing protein n=1 Tax=Snodgrassella sp. TaxID=2815304 RepID=UPI002589F09F|nr:membrane lipoprotein lipid attachment site-containing protein [Snodgrassella sp.]MCO6517502.1 membrane lipoprotein lipid attachment site-containing protein [Snodgrassella sp.]
MKKYVFIILFILLLSSCNKIKVIEENNRESHIVVNKELNRADSDTMEKFMNFNHIEQTPVDSLIKKYPPLWDKTFILGKKDGFITEFRVGLLKQFTQKEIRSRDIKIREVTWASSDEENLTVWFEEKDHKWLPVEHLIWDKNAEF